MLNFKQIAIGFINSTKSEFGIANSKIEELAIRRYEICLHCPILSTNKLYCDKAKNGCGCKLSWKIRSESKCPEKKW